MGGNKKQPQRTKGNTRPSSSGRSAERLLASGAAASNLGGFVGFGNIQLQSNHLGILKATASPKGEVDTLIDGDCRMLMKRMTKKDAITRLKAVQEFQSLCVNCSEESLLGALPFWPRLFNKLCLDIDRRVREAVHNANNQLVLRVKRNLAPHIKTMMGNWLLGQCDPYAPAASAAKKAFKSSFSEDKQLEAILYCKENILNIIVDNLFHQTPQTLSDSELAPVEEVEEMYSRVLSSSLLALGSFLSQVPPSEHEKLLETYTKILTEGKFWKLSKYQICQVRSAWFNVAATMCQAIPSLLNAHLSKLCPAVLGKLDESDPMVVPALWDAALNVLVAFEDIWKHVNIQKAVLPKLWSILRKGCDGNAKCIGPYLLPLLSKIPADAHSAAGKVYTDFFANLRQGLALEKVQNTTSECEALVTAYLECLRYAVTDSSSEVHRIATIAEDLLITDFLPIVGSSIVEESSRLSQTSLYLLFEELLRHLHDQSLCSDASSAAFFQNLDKSFWNEFSLLCETYVENADCRKGGSASLLNLRYMFATLAHAESSIQTTRKKAGTRNVRFSDQTSSELEPPRDALAVSKMATGEKSDDPLATNLNDHLKNCVFKLSAIGLRKYGDERSVPHLQFFVEMMAIFASEELFQTLLESASQQPSITDEKLSRDVAAEFCEHVVHQWLTESSSDEVISHVIALIVDILRFVKDKDRKLDILNQMCHVENASVLLSAICKCLKINDCCQAVIKSWFKGTTFSNTLLKWVETLNKSDSGAHGELDVVIWDMLNLCLVPTQSVDTSIVTTECVGEILNRVHQMLPRPDKMAITLADKKRSCKLSQICRLASNFFGHAARCWTFPESDWLLFAFFKFGWFLSTNSEAVSSTSSLNMDIGNCWINGVRSLIKYQGGLIMPEKFLHKAAMLIHDALLLAKDPMAHFASVLEFTQKFLDAAKNSNVGNVDEESNRLMTELIRIILPTTEEWVEMEVSLGQKGLIGCILDGELFFREIPADSCDESRRSMPLERPLACSLLAADLLTRSDWERASLERNNVEGTRLENVMLPHVLGVLSTATYCGRSDEVSDEKCSHLWIETLVEKLEMLVKAFDNPDRLLRECSGRAEQIGHLHAYCLRDLMAIIGSENNALPELSLETDGDLRIHVFQALLPSHKSHCEDFLVRFVDKFEFGNPQWVAVVTTCMRNWDRTNVSEKSVAEIVNRLIGGLMLYKGENASAFLFAGKLPGDWPSLCHNVQLARLLTILVNDHCNVFLAEHWDFILCCLGAWLNSCHACRQTMWAKLEHQAFASVIYRLTTSVACTVNQPMGARDDTVVANLITEWSEFFAPKIFPILLDLFVDYAAFVTNRGKGQFGRDTRVSDLYSLPVKHLMDSAELVAGNLVAALQWIPSDAIVRNSLQYLLDARWDESDAFTSVTVKTALNSLCPLLLSPSRHVRAGAYAVLHNLVPVLAAYVEERTKKQQETEDKEEEMTNSMPGALMDVLLKTGNAIDKVLSELEFGETCAIPPRAELYYVASGYLYGSSLLLQLFALMASEARSSQVGYLRDSGIIRGLVRNLFCLMPSNPTLSPSAASVTQKGPNKAVPTIFTEMPVSDLKYAVAMLFDLPRLACYVYFDVVRRMPALVREWWNGLDRRSSCLVEKFTAKYISPLLSSEDIGAVRNAQRKFKNMTVKPRPAAREVIATYAVDEISFELIVRLASNHPLGAVTIEDGRRIGVSNPQWREWLLQLTTFLMHQNGSILDGLVLWKRNIDKKFEGVEECYVCFYVLHGTTCELPKKYCRTCKKKFHSSCLYKWFVTSGHSTCPLCRSIF